jgi:hypothetical protein
MSETDGSRTALSMVLHCKIKHLNFPLDPHHPAGAIISSLQLCKGWKGFIASRANVSEPNELFHVHAKIKHLNFPFDPHHLPGVIIHAIQLCKGWKGFIASRANVSEPNELLHV